MTVDYIGVDVRAKFGDSRLKTGRIIRLFPTGPVLRTLVQYLSTFCSRPKIASGVISCRFVGPIDLDKCLKFREPR